MRKRHAAFLDQQKNVTKRSLPPGARRSRRHDMQRPPPFDDCHARVGYWDGMDVERIIDEIEHTVPGYEAAMSRTQGLSELRFFCCTVN